MTTLTDRYVHAATRWMPGRTRQEVEAELRERIEDTLAAHDGGPDAEREVLEELGDPLEVAVTYTGREPVLIGPRWFFIWLRLVLLLLAIVPPIVAAVSLVASAIEGDSLGAMIGSAVGALWFTAVQIAFWTTLVFAALEWTGVIPEADEAWTVDRLPESAGTRPGVAETTAAVAFLAVSATLLVWQQFGSPFTEDGETIAVLDPDLWSWWIPAVLVLLALEAAHAIWAHVAGWTWPVAVTNAALALAFAVITVPVLQDNAMVNPELVRHLDWSPAVVEQTMSWIVVGVIVVTVWEIADGFLKARRAARVR